MGLSWYFFLDYLLVISLGCAAAIAELLSIYNNDYTLIFKIRAGNAYILLNGIIAAISLVAVKHIKGTDTIYNKLEIGNILIAGASGMALIRSSVATIKVKGKKVEAGLGMILQVFLDTANTAFDRKRSKLRLVEIKKIMEGVDYDTDKESLQAACISDLHTLDKKDAVKMEKEIASIARLKISKQRKALLLGINIAKFTGLELLEAGVEVLKEPKKNDKTEHSLDYYLDELDKIK